MSDEGGVMLSDVMQDVTPQEVTPVCGRRGSGHLVGLGRFRTLSRISRAIKLGSSPACKPQSRGVYMSQRLSFLDYGKAAGGQARVRTTFGKSDRVGS